MSDAAGKLEPTGLTPHVSLRRIEIVVNPRSGGVGARAAAECERLLHGLPLEANIVELGTRHVDSMLEQAVSSAPDAVIVLAGDGTARTVAALAGPNGPLVAPLPGGTMNMLPRALYGPGDWRAALTLALTRGTDRPVPGGEVDGRPFYVAAILGSPALWGPAREAMRSGKVILALLYARRATRQMLAGRIRYRLDGGDPGRAEALALLTPLISKAKPAPEALEAAVMSFASASEVFRLAARTLINDWRADPAIVTTETRRVHVWARGRIPAVLDGEPMFLGRKTDVVFHPVAFRALAPALVAQPPAGEILNAEFAGREPPAGEPLA
jgi:diacylglycerol kinase family enzyme